MQSAFFLFTGVVFSFLIPPSSPLQLRIKKLTPLLLGLAICGVGAGLNLPEILKVSAEGFVLTILSISVTLALGIILGQRLGLPINITLMLSAGTAICGGSAIAAMSSALKADEDETSLALGLVFILNFIALLIFPELGRLLQLTETQFGLWSAIAIHDTSSVVGAASSYGPFALELATTVKLGRALWIAPVTILLLYISRRFLDSKYQKSHTGFKIPWFIWGFLGMSILTSYLSAPPEFIRLLQGGSQILFPIIFFLIGYQMNFNVIKKIGPKPAVLALILWLIISVLSLAAVTR